MKTVLLFFKFFFNWVLFQASHSPKTFFFLISVWLDVDYWFLSHVAVLKIFETGAMMPSRIFSPGCMSLVLHGCGWRSSCFKTISAHKKPSKERDNESGMGGLPLGSNMGVGEVWQNSSLHLFSLPWLFKDSWSPYQLFWETTSDRWLIWNLESIKTTSLFHTCSC